MGHNVIESTLKATILSLKQISVVWRAVQILGDPQALPGGWQLTVHETVQLSEDSTMYLSIKNMIKEQAK